MELTEQHISNLIAILGKIAFPMLLFPYLWAVLNPELAARVTEKFLDVPKRFLDIFHRILDMIQKKGK
jgi:hypothetical protein